MKWSYGMVLPLMRRRRMTSIFLSLTAFLTRRSGAQRGAEVVVAMRSEGVVPR